jgi:hypothetical protein
MARTLKLLSPLAVLVFSLELCFGLGPDPVLRKIEVDQIHPVIDPKGIGCV